MSEITAREVARTAGIHLNSAYRRLDAYRDGGITREQLFAPVAPGHRRNNPNRDALVDEVVAATGLSRQTAVHRVRQYRCGELPKKCLMMSKGEMAAYRNRQCAEVLREKGSVMPTKNLGLGPRKKLHEIPGGTAWERENLGV